MMRLSIECDRVGCMASIEIPPFRWGQGDVLLVRALVEARWRLADDGRLYCADHHEGNPKPAPLPPFKLGAHR